MENIIYTKNNCPQCKTVLGILEQQGITNFRTENLDKMSGFEKENIITSIAFEHGVIPKTAPIIVWESKLKTPDEFILEMRGA